MQDCAKASPLPTPQEGLRGLPPPPRLHLPITDGIPALSPISQEGHVGEGQGFDGFSFPLLL